MAASTRVSGRSTATTRSRAGRSACVISGRASPAARRAGSRPSRSTRATTGRPTGTWISRECNTMTKRLFAVINTRGPNWDDARPMEEQVDWRGHADFMNGLAAEGFVLLRAVRGHARRPADRAGRGPDRGRDALGARLLGRQGPPAQSPHRALGPAAGLPGPLTLGWGRTTLA